jgi:hypothetical protein
MSRKTLFLMLVLALSAALRPIVEAQSPCNLRNGFQFRCFGTVITVNPRPVVLGANMTLNVDSRSQYGFDVNTVIVLEPAKGVGFGVGLRTLCGGLRGGARNTPCPVFGGTSKTMTLSAPNDGSLPAGTYLLRAENWDRPVVVGNVGFCTPTCTEADAGYVQFGTTSTPRPQPTPPPPAPYITNLTVVNHLPNRDQCVASQPSTVTLNVQGQNFNSNGGQIVVSHIYFVDRHGTFRTDYQGRDSRVAANMMQRSANFLQGSVDLTAIHQRAGDPFGLGGNYYVQVQNPDGQVNPRAPFYFTVLPYQGGDSRCR